MSETKRFESLSVDEKVKDICRRFELVWDNQRPQFEDFLLLVDREHRPLLLKELLAIDLDHRAKLQERPSPEDYTEGLPEFSQTIEFFFAEQKSPKPPISATTDINSQGIAQTQVVAGIEQNAPFATNGTTESKRETALTTLGDFELISQLGEGGMGVVWKARQLSVGGRLVALKLIRPDKLSHYHPTVRENILARFQTESSAAAQLDHDHITTVYEVGEIDDQPYYAMKFVEGASLIELIKELPLPNKQAAEYCRQVASALAVAHDSGVLHRDLKPHNVMVEEATDRALLTDFGLAKLADDDTQVTMMDRTVVFGSPPYMSPEQSRHSGKVNAATDIYGLGATLYHVLTGKPPFQAATVLETLQQVVENEPTPLRQINANIHADLETICLKALEKSPEKRYESATAMADDLQRFIQGRPILARPVGAAEKFYRLCRRNPLTTSLISLCILVLLLGITGSTIFAVLMRSEANRANHNAEIAAQREAEAKVARQDAVNQLYESKLSETESLVAARNDSPIGWSWQAMQNLQDAFDLETTIQDELRFRNVRLKVLNTVDVRKVGELKFPRDPVKGDQPPVIDRVAFSSNGAEIFAVEQKKTPACRMFGFDTATSQQVEEYAMPINLAERARRAIMGLPQHDGFRSVALSPDGRWAAGGTRFGNVMIWDRTHPDVEPQKIGSFDSEAHDVAFAADSKTIFASAAPASKNAKDAEVSAWKLSEEWRPDGSIKGHGHHFSLSRDKSRIAIVGNDATTLFDVISRKPLGAADALEAVSFSHDDYYLIGVRNGDNCLFDLNRRRDVTSFGGNAWQTGDTMQTLGETLFVVGSAKETEGVRIYDFQNRSIECVIPTPGRHRPRFAVSPDGANIAVTNAHGVSLYEVRLPMVKRTKRLRTCNVQGLLFSSDSNQLIVNYQYKGPVLWFSRSMSVDPETMTSDNQWSSVYFASNSQGALNTQLRSPVMAADRPLRTFVSADPMLGVHFRDQLGPTGAPIEIPGVSYGSVLVKLDESIPFSQTGDLTESALELNINELLADNTDRLGDGDNALEMILNVRSANDHRRSLMLATELVGTHPVDGEILRAKNTRNIYPAAGCRSYVGDYFNKQELESTWKLRIAITSEFKDASKNEEFILDSVLFAAKKINKQRQRISPMQGPVAMSPDGRQAWAAVKEDVLASWSVPDGKLLYSYNDRLANIANSKAGVTSVAILGDTVVVGSLGGIVVLLDAATGEPRDILKGSGGEINSIKKINANEVLVSTEQGHVSILNLKTKKFRQLSKASTTVADCSIDSRGKLVAYSDADSIVVLTNSNGKWEPYFELGPFASNVVRVSLSPNGEYLAYAVEGSPFAAQLLRLKNVE